MFENETVRRAAEPVPGAVLRWTRLALGVPVLHKLWLANAALVFAAAMGAAGLAARGPGVAIWVGAGLVAAAAAVLHLHLLRLALRPLTLLARAAERVAAGDEAVRAPRSALADPELARLVDVFNASLESVSRERARLRELAARAQDSLEAERDQVSRSLHEGTVQTLTALLMRLRLVRRMRTEAERETVLDSMRDDLVDAIEIVRRAARTLRPAALSELGVERAVEGLAAEACAAAGVRLSAELEALGGSLGAEASTALYRVMQEAIDNALRHARPTELKVTLRREGPWVVAAVVDDGEGFPVAPTLERGRCLGLFAMEQRVARAGGTLRVSSLPGTGTRVEVRIPAFAAGAGLAA